MRRVLALLLPVLAHAQAAKPDEPIQSARPDFTESPQILLPGTFQIEAGLTRWGRSAEMRPRTEFGEATLRFGLVPRTELRLDLPTYVLSDDPGGRGWDDVRVSAVSYLGRMAGVDVGVLPALTLAAGTPGVSEGQTEPELYLLLRRETRGDASFAGTFGTAYARRDGQDASRSEATFSYSRTLGAHLEGFVEYAGFYLPHERPHNLAHFGLTLTVAPDAAFDVHFGYGLNRGSEQGLLGAGYSLRF